MEINAKLELGRKLLGIGERFGYSFSLVETNSDPSAGSGPFTSTEHHPHLAWKLKNLKKPPIAAAEDMCDEKMMFVRGEAEMSEYSLLRQDNTAIKIVESDLGESVQHIC